MIAAITISTATFSSSAPSELSAVTIVTSIVLTTPLSKSYAGLRVGEVYQEEKEGEDSG